MKKQTKARTHLSMDTLTEVRSRLGARELSEVELKLISGGRMAESQGGCTSDTGDTDQ
ncbi:hypothetical protein [Archangium violaceum]|uniref:hypothetical protein n=1 Tax=Archangium violaceum TaxID=83451 RepID=UPI0036DC7299